MALLNNQRRPGEGGGAASTPRRTINQTPEQHTVRTSYTKQRDVTTAISGPPLN